jgi:DNA-binding CsgD family transcriptional regulator
MPELLDTTSEVKIPISEISSRKLSVLESIVAYLKNQGMTLSQIASTIQRDQRTVWTIAERARRKAAK